jgi:hypothetical protein
MFAQVAAAPESRRNGSSVPHSVSWSAAQRTAGLAELFTNGAFRKEWHQADQAGQGLAGQGATMTDDGM